MKSREGMSIHISNYFTCKIVAEIYNNLQSDSARSAVGFAPVRKLSPIKTHTVIYWKPGHIREQATRSARHADRLINQALRQGFALWPQLGRSAGPTQIAYQDYIKAVFFAPYPSELS